MEKVWCKNSITRIIQGAQSARGHIELETSEICHQLIQSKGVAVTEVQIHTPQHLAHL